VPGLRRLGALRPSGARQEDAARRRQQRKPHGWLLLCSLQPTPHPNNRFTRYAGERFPGSEVAAMEEGMGCKLAKTGWRWEDGES
jgi:hypothetical protein